MKKIYLSLFILVFICQVKAVNDFLSQRKVELTPQEKEEYYKNLEQGRIDDTFNPLNIGNYWVYYYEVWPETGYDKIRITDSKVVNDTIFYMKSREDNGGWYNRGYWSKNINNTTIVWDSLNMLMDSYETDFIIDEDFSVTDSVSVFHSYYLLGVTTPFVCRLTDLGFINVWGILTDYKYFTYYHPEVVDVYHTMLWARGFGYLSMDNEWGGVGLVGCVIDGVVYGDTTVTAAEEITLPEIPQIKISSSPNPFRSNTLISYQLPTKSNNAEIEIYNTKGQLIKKEKLSESGTYNWDARDSHDQQVSSGIYLIRIKTDKEQAIRKAIYIR